MDRFGVILVAAGSGERFGRPKADVEFGGVSLLARSAAAFASFPARVAVLREPRELEGWTVVTGGARRRDSVANGLAALPDSVETVLVHDAARPLVSPDLVARVAEAARSHDCVIPAVPVTDTIKRIDGGFVAETVDRSTLVAAQTPQAFSVALLRRALAGSAEDATDEAGLVERLGEPVYVIAGDARNLKITVPADLAVAAALL
ncbi:MAG: 2-C-methyl-D-erythritol 4-phosphate cytidylyltransferase [Planctomycetota bacterium]|jgi:2-C-methyl-D-erythritol 4-phosphate cytidylyltransferase